MIKEKGTKRPVISKNLERRGGRVFQGFFSGRYEGDRGEGGIKFIVSRESKRRRATGEGRSHLPSSGLTLFAVQVLYEEKRGGGIEEMRNRGSPRKNP